MRFRIPRLDRTYRQALLVQQDQERIEDISVIERILKNRGYNTTIIGVGECTKRNVLSGIEQLIERSKKDSRSLFYYTGHGSEMPGYTNGISMNKGNNEFDPWDRRILPYSLLRRLGKVKGKKAIIIDSCLSGEFVENAIKYSDEILIRDYVIITSTTKDGYTICSKWDLHDNHPLRDKKIGLVTHWMYESARRVKRLNLAEAQLGKYSVKFPEKVHIENENSDYSKIKLQMQRTGDADFFL